MIVGDFWMCEMFVTQMIFCSMIMLHILEGWCSYGGRCQWQRLGHTVSLEESSPGWPSDSTNPYRFQEMAIVLTRSCSLVDHGSLPFFLSEGAGDVARSSGNTSPGYQINRTSKQVHWESTFSMNDPR